jgi:hypothetical protein
MTSFQNATPEATGSPGDHSLAQHIPGSHTLLLQFSPHKDAEPSLLGFNWCASKAPAKQRHEPTNPFGASAASPNRNRNLCCPVLPLRCAVLSHPLRRRVPSSPVPVICIPIQYLKYIYLCLRSGLLSCPAALITFFFLGLVTASYRATRPFSPLSSSLSRALANTLFASRYCSL